MTDQLNYSSAKVGIDMDMTRSSLSLFSSTTRHAERKKDRESFFRQTELSQSALMKTSSHLGLKANASNVFNFSLDQIKNSYDWKSKVQNITTSTSDNKEQLAPTKKRKNVNRLKAIVSSSFQPGSTKKFVRAKHLTIFCENNFLVPEQTLSDKDQLLASLISRTDFSITRLAHALTHGSIYQYPKLSEIVEIFTEAKVVLPERKDKVTSFESVLAWFLPASPLLRMKLLAKDRLDHSLEPPFSQSTQDLLVRVLALGLNK